MISRSFRTTILSTVGGAALVMGTSAAQAQVASVTPETTAQAAIVSNQYNNAVGPDTSLVIDSDVQSALIGVTGPVTTGSVIGTTSNTVTTRVIGNEAVLGIVSDVNQDIAGSAVQALTAYFTDLATDRLRAGAIGAADLVIAMTQSNNEVDATASNTSSVAYLGTGAVSTSTVNVTTNTQQTQGALNLAENSIDSSANSTNLTAGIVATQVNEPSTLTLTTDAETGIRITGATSNATDAKLTVSGNTQSTVGAGNSMTNSLSGDVNSATLAASLPTTGNSVASTRINLAGPDESTADGLSASLVLTDSNNSTFTLTGTVVGDQWTVDTFSLTPPQLDALNAYIDANSAIASRDPANFYVVSFKAVAPSASTVAPFAISSAQVQGDGGQAPGAVTLSATTDGVGAGFELSVAGSVAGTSVETSSLVNSSNTASSSIAGNEVGNTIDLTQNTLATGATPAPGVVGAVASFQGIDGSVTATTMGVAGLAVETTVGGELSDSTVTTSSNRVAAAATANTGQNSILVDANSINTGAFPAPAASLAPVSATQINTNANAAFAVSSSQVAAGSVSALLVDNAVTPTSGAAIQTSVADAITGSTIESNLNVLSAAASGNAVSNLADLAGTNVTTTTSVANSQNLLANVTSVIGVEGTDGVAPSQFSFAGATILAGQTSVISAPAGISSTGGRCASSPRSSGPA